MGGAHGAAAQNLQNGLPNIILKQLVAEISFRTAMGLITTID
jgi:hypothetical protein